jgi:hypothetical protein
LNVLDAKNKKSRRGGTPEGIRPRRLTLQQAPRQSRVALYPVIRSTFIVWHELENAMALDQLPPRLAAIYSPENSGKLPSARGLPQYVPAHRRPGNCQRIAEGLRGWMGWGLSLAPIRRRLGGEHAARMRQPATLAIEPLSRR